MHSNSPTLYLLICIPLTSNNLPLCEKLMPMPVPFALFCDSWKFTRAFCVAPDMDLSKGDW